MSSSQDAHQLPYSYVGEELELFADANNWKAYFASVLRDVIVGDVLEVGAGIGQTTRRLLDGRQRSWLCLEPDPHLAEKTREWVTSASPSPRPDVMVGTTADLEAGPRFDAILYIDVLEHIEHDREEAARAAALLKPGGNLVVLSPAFMQVFSEMDRALGHFRRYTRATLEAVMPPSVRRRSLRYMDSVGLIASLTNRLLLKQGGATRKQIAFWDGTIIPVSRVVDPLFARWFGRSVVGVYQRV